MLKNLSKSSSGLFRITQRNMSYQSLHRKMKKFSPKKYDKIVFQKVITDPKEPEKVKELNTPVEIAFSVTIIAAATKFLFVMWPDSLPYLGIFTSTYLAAEFHNYYKKNKDIKKDSN